jgi:hypothetical protein
VSSTALSRDRLIRVAQATRNRKECPLQQHHAALLMNLLIFVFLLTFALLRIAVFFKSAKGRMPCDQSAVFSTGVHYCLLKTQHSQFICTGASEVNADLVPCTKQLPANTAHAERKKSAERLYEQAFAQRLPLQVNVFAANATAAIENCAVEACGE